MLSPDEIQGIKIGSEWHHYNGNHYTVVMFTNVITSDPAKYPTTVVYQNCDRPNGQFYSRPVSDWFRSMTLVSNPSQAMGGRLRKFLENL